MPFFQRFASSNLVVVATNYFKNVTVVNYVDCCYDINGEKKKTPRIKFNLMD